MLRITLLFISFYLVLCQDNLEKSLLEDFDQLLSDYPVSPLQLSYVSNLQSISSTAILKKKLERFKKFYQKLEKFNTTITIDIEIIRYETQLAIKRINLEIKQSRLNEDIPINNMTKLQLSKEWYLHWLISWTGVDMTVADIQEYGQSEVNRIINEMDSIKQIYKKSDFSSFLSGKSFQMEDRDKIQSMFEQKRDLVKRNLFKFFPSFDLPTIQIKKGENQRLVQTPGYYSNDVFYFNLFDKPFISRKADWLFIHEANPGHHYQRSFENQLMLPDYRNRFFNSGYKEAWAAYVEDYGKEIGLYKEPSDYYGRLEWDLIRSLRVYLDPALNYRGWSDEEALNYWRRYIKDQDDIARREIARMRRWPLQVLTYKLGSKILKDLKSDLFKQKPNLSLLAFHKRVLENGSIPIMVLADFLKKEL